jgi:hypothetical protein
MVSPITVQLWRLTSLRKVKVRVLSSENYRYLGHLVIVDQVHHLLAKLDTADLNILRTVVHIVD